MFERTQNNDNTKERHDYRGTGRKSETFGDLWVTVTKTKTGHMSEAGRRRPGRVGQAPSRLADEQAAAAADAPNRRRAASAPPERQRAAQQPLLVPALSTRKAENLHVRAAALKVHPIALENVDSGYWCERSAASRGTAEAAFRALGTLGKVLVDVPLGASDD